MIRYMNARCVFSIVLMGVVLGAGCRKPSPTSQPAEFTYDPEQDPLVNPPSLFEPPPKDRGQVATDETLFLRLNGSPGILNPIFISSLSEFTLADAIYASLFTFDREMKWRLNDDMTESIQESDDHTEFIVKMKPGLTWQDGAPLTAHDVVFSWQQILDPQVPCPAQKPGTEAISECVALDDYTVRYVQPEPLATRYWNLLFPIIPKHIFEKEKAAHPDLKGGDYYNQCNRQPVGNGKYRIVEWKENDRIVVERWEDFQGHKPYFRRIVFRIVPDDNVALLSFEKGSIDVIRQLTAQQFARETNSDSFRAVGYKAWGTEWTFSYIGWNMDGSNPFFNDKRVRYAMTHALNQTLIREKISYNLTTPCYGIFHPDSWMFNPEVELLEYDPARSAVLLDEAGWGVDAQDGWRYRNVNGQRVKFEFTLTLPQGSSTGAKVAAIFQQDLRKLGVELKTQTLEWASFIEKVRNHEFQAEMASWGTGTDPDTNWNLWRTEQYEKGRNYGGYSNPRVDKLFELARAEFDFDKRRQYYQEIHKLIYDDQPYTFMSNGPILAVFNKRIRGVQLSPRGILNFDPSFEAWWVKQPAMMQP